MVICHAHRDLVVVTAESFVPSIEAIELFYEVADPSEIEERLKGETFVTQLEVTVG